MKDRIFVPGDNLDLQSALLPLDSQYVLEDIDLRRTQRLKELDVHALPRVI